MQLTIKGVLSYPYLFQPRSIKEDQEPKFSCSVLIPKGDAQIAQIEEAINTEKNNSFPSGFPHNGKLCLKDCAVESPNDPKLANYMELRCTAKADQRPQVCNMEYAPLTDPAMVYPGMVAWVAVNTYSFNMPLSKGISAGLNGVMITNEEPPLGRLDNRPSVEQLFANVGAPATNAATAQPAPSIPKPPTPPGVPKAPAVATFPPEGWTAHPEAEGYWYKGEEVLNEQDLRARFNIIKTSFDQ